MLPLGPGLDGLGREQLAAQPNQAPLVKSVAQGRRQRAHGDFELPAAAAAAAAAAAVHKLALYCFAAAAAPPAAADHRVMLCCFAAAAAAAVWACQAADHRVMLCCFAAVAAAAAAAAAAVWACKAAFGVAAALLRTVSFLDAAHFPAYDDLAGCQSS